MVYSIETTYAFTAKLWPSLIISGTATHILPNLLGLIEAYTFYRYGFTYKRLYLSLILKGVMIIAAQIVSAWLLKKPLIEHVNLFLILYMILGFLWSCFHYIETTPFGRE